MSTYVSVELELYGPACTDSALAFVNPEDSLNDPIWIPRSRVENLEDIVQNQLADPIGWTTKEKVEVIMPTWLAEDKGLEVYAEELD